MMDDEEVEHLIQQLLETGCPPPLFDLPAPPPPPFLDTPLSAFCTGDCDTSSLPVMSSLDSVQDIFHSIVIVIVSSLVVVISVLLAAIFIWR
jgi:hypothetical protein